MESAIKKNRYFWPLVAGAALLLVLLAQPAHAAGTKYWVGPNPNVLWTNPNNWSNTAGGPPGAGQPISGDEVNLTSTSNKTAVYDTTLNPLLAALTIDATGGGTFTLSQSANALISTVRRVYRRIRQRPGRPERRHPYRQCSYSWW